MSKLEQFGEAGKKEKAIPKGYFNPREDLVESPDQEGIFRDISGKTRELLDLNHELVRVLKMKNFSPDEEKRILNELRKCSEDAGKEMVKKLKELKYISDN